MSRAWALPFDLSTIVLIDGPASRYGQRRRAPLASSDRARVASTTRIHIAERTTVDALATFTETPPTAELLIALVARMRGGDEAALQALYDMTIGKLYALAISILRNAEDAEEVVSSTYAYAWANASRFDAQRANPLGWLIMLCRSRALDHLRQQRKQPLTLDIDTIGDIEPDATHEPDDLLNLVQQRSRIHAALSQLTPERRKLVSLAFLQGLSHQEISDATGLPLGTVKSHVRRALAQLRDTLEAP